MVGEPQLLPTATWTPGLRQPSAEQAVVQLSRPLSGSNLLLKNPAR
jgi:hypothetical protein